MQKYLQDPEFRKQKEGEGFHFPMSKSDFDTYAKVASIHRFKESRGYPTHSSALADWKDETGFRSNVAVPANQSNQTAAQQTIQKLAEKADEAVLLNPSNGGSDLKTNDNWTAEKARAWLLAHPTPRTAKDKQIQAELLAWAKASMKE